MPTPAVSPQYPQSIPNPTRAERIYGRLGLRRNVYPAATLDEPMTAALLDDATSELLRLSEIETLITKLFAIWSKMDTLENMTAGECRDLTDSAEEIVTMLRERVTPMEREA